MLVHLGIESTTPSYRRNLFILSLYDDMLAGAGATQRCTLSVPGHHWTWARQREAPIVLLPRTRLPRVVPDTPFDHLAPHGDAGESAITNACTPREDTGTQPLTRCRVGRAGRITLAFGDLPSHVGGN
jgi:hypothetical protein